MYIMNRDSLIIKTFTEDVLKINIEVKQCCYDHKYIGR